MDSFIEQNKLLSLFSECSFTAKPKQNLTKTQILRLVNSRKTGAE